ncbi:MAG: alpha/beta fold hydrolase [Bacteroidales bacterium]|nr:alpha/beta fold hydrolase [Bacteroidales bacterium]
MKRTTLLLITLLTALSLYGQDITGEWNGILKVQGIQLRVVFHIDRTGEGYGGTMDSPDQGAFGIPVSSVSYEGLELVIRITQLGVEYNGTPGMNDTITGTFTQFGQSFPLNLTREEPEKEVLIRPQDPVEPFSYKSEEVRFENKKEGVTLAGTLTMPDKGERFPAVVLISGSGPQNRDEEVFGHRPFLVLADHLTKNGIAVLRFDDRGIGGSTGDLSGATSAQFAGDVKAAVRYLQKRKEINKRQIGLVGHSEGGIIAPMVAADSRKVDFIVLLAGTGIRGDRLILMQQELILRAGGMEEDAVKEANTFTEGAYQIIMQNRSRDSLQSELMAYFKQNAENLPDALKPGGISEDAMIASQVNELLNPWMMFFLQHDPAPVLEKVSCPVLAINGEKDLQVPAEVNLEAIEEALHRGGNRKVTIKSLPGLNHLFQECETGLPGEYPEIEQTFSPVALTEITDWISEQVR